MSSSYVSTSDVPSHKLGQKNPLSGGVIFQATTKPRFLSSGSGGVWKNDWHGLDYKPLLKQGKAKKTKP